MRNPLVLLVDDYADSREMYADFLAFSGFRVAEARDGREALEKAVEVKPDLILMDLSLPGSTAGRRRGGSRRTGGRGGSRWSRSPGTPSRGTRTARSRRDATPSSRSPASPRTWSSRSGGSSGAATGTWGPARRRTVDEAGDEDEEVRDPLRFGAIVIGDEPAEVLAINHEDPAAVVSSAHIGVYDATRENVLAHEQVNETVMRRHTVIPMSFGTVFRTREDVQEPLRSAADAFHDVLDKMRDKLEFGLKVLWDRDAAVREIERDDEGASAPSWTGSRRRWTRS